AVQPTALAEEEVAGVDDLPHFAERLGVGLTDLRGHQTGQALGIGLHQPADVGDCTAAYRRRHVRPGRLGSTGSMRCGRERARITERPPGAHLGGWGRFYRAQPATGRLRHLQPGDDRRDASAHQATPIRSCPYSVLARMSLVGHTIQRLGRSYPTVTDAA